MASQAKKDGRSKFGRSSTGGSAQTPAEFAHMVPFGQLAKDLAAGTVPNFSYIVPDECHDSHGAPPWCVDSSPINLPI
jgi:hypothetical protein